VLPGETEGRGCVALIKGPNPTATKAKRNRRQQDVFHGSSRILQAKKLAAPLFVTCG
jgi:hypothetical protein